MNAQKRLVVFLTALVLAGLSFAGPKAGERPESVKGYVVDSACAFVRDVKKPLQGGKCAVECAKEGSPLVILSEDGIIYWPISDAMPAQGQNPRLMLYAGKLVTATGKVLERGGSRAIVIERIEAVPAKQ